MPARGLTLQRSAIGAYDILVGERRPAHGRWVRMLGRSTNRPTGLKIDLKTARARDGSADARPDVPSHTSGGSYVPKAAAWLMLIFSDDGFCRRRRSGRGRRDREGNPSIPAGGPVCRVELSVSLKIEIALHVADRKQEPNLGTDAQHLWLAASHTVARTTLAADLL